MSDEEIYACIHEAREASHLAAIVDAALARARVQRISLAEALAQIEVEEEAAR